LNTKLREQRLISATSSRWVRSLSFMLAASASQ
jgi:hypothetical protein